MYTITLNDGTELNGLELNGNNFISDTIIEDTVFEGNLSAVTVSNGETTEEYEDMILIANRVIDGRSWFILGEKTLEQKAAERIEALIGTNTGSITDVQLALTEIYELVAGGV